ncbi:HTH-type transcriptional regulator BetI [Defluviimonas aquaemixtae]|uniref:HTH-type transcriptional regulator BetI n=1 Tax=Albidovulum aquaemixtae TaxID=1542388 RepID=A0A2R8B3U8_9RHOB|nr:TetR family transcriptional regulator C-terminal domain-containing protein [Defluviimonas aquaemixtae]SPH17262.1 HTH-type transcriptional regulator BetI [Defluviimonas aquaemixtae]
MTRREMTERPRKERAENAERRRDQIIDATLRSIVRNGLSGTTLASVSDEAGLSQGVAVFYFRNKQSLLGAALRRQYETYQVHWQTAVAEAGPDPAAQIVALIRSDFSPAICNAESLIIWHAFWGEANARPIYGEISGSFEAERALAMRSACTALLQAEGRSVTAADDIAVGIDAMTDGLWLAMYLSDQAPDLDRPMRLAATYLSAAFPAHTDHFRTGLGIKSDAV